MTLVVIVGATAFVSKASIRRIEKTNIVAFKTIHS